MSHLSRSRSFSKIDSPTAALAMDRARSIHSMGRKTAVTTAVSKALKKAVPTYSAADALTPPAAAMAPVRTPSSSVP